jgi:excisionase family DNA binding protein
VAHPAYIREKAREMRVKKQLTIDELAERLALSRTTIYYWVRDLPIPTSGSGGGFRTEAQRRGTRAMQAHYRRLRESAYDRALTSFPEMIQQRGFRDFLILFITEGYRRSSHSVAIANSDPAVVFLAARWMRHLSRRKVTYRVQVHADQDLGKVRQFWSDVLEVDGGAIKLQRKSNSNQLSRRTWRSEHGVLTVRTSDSYFREAMRAWSDRLRTSWLDSAPVGA